MQDRMEDKQKELEEKLKDQVGTATPEPHPETPIDNANGHGITINGGNFSGATTIIIGNTAPITINLMLPCPPIYIGMPTHRPYRSIWRTITQNSGSALRQITRKFSALLSKSRQISRNRQTRPKSPQPQQSRHFQPIPTTSPIPPNISLLHTI